MVLSFTLLLFTTESFFESQNGTAAENLQAQNFTSLSVPEPEELDPKFSLQLIMRATSFHLIYNKEF